MKSAFGNDYGTIFFSTPMAGEATEKITTAMAEDKAILHDLNMASQVEKTRFAFCANRLANGKKKQ